MRIINTSLIVMLASCSITNGMEHQEIVKPEISKRILDILPIEIWNRIFNEAIQSSTSINDILTTTRNYYALLGYHPLSKDALLYTLKSKLKQIIETANSLDEIAKAKKVYERIVQKEINRNEESKKVELQELESFIQNNNSEFKTIFFIGKKAIKQLGAGYTISIRCKPGMTALELKTRVRSKTDIPTKDQQVIRAGIEYQNDQVLPCDIAKTFNIYVI